MTLLEYIASLQDQGLSDKEIFDKAQEWKKNNPPVEDEVTSEDIVEEVVVDPSKDEGCCRQNGCNCTTQATGCVREFSFWRYRITISRK
jgi:hypothetical protein